MRIRSLCFQGVGPYLARQEIDFDQLGHSGLYLINGPTGAGKSTIIDCITFALYGELSDKAADKSRLRSDFAEGTDKTEVDLVFETSAGTFRVIRSPEFLRAKKAGSGLTRSLATCSVFRVLPGGTEETIATNVGSAKAELRKLVGLSREQFVQTVVLPQGKFADFLHADTGSRAEVLKSIFDTSIFERTVSILNEDAKLVRNEVERATDTLVGQIGRVAALIELDDETRVSWEALASDSLDDALLAEVDALAPVLEEASDVLMRAAQGAEAALRSADDDRKRAEREQQAQARAQKAAEGERDARQRCERARAALVPYDDLARATGIALDDDADVDAWRDRQAAAEREVGALKALVTTEVAVLAWPGEEAERTKSIESKRDEQRHASRRLEQIPTVTATLHAKAKARPSASEIANSRQRKADLDRERDRLDELDTETRRRTSSRKALDAAKRELQEADRRYQEASQRYRSGIAVELSQGLEGGSPCPVCGATEHPSPAHEDGVRVSADEVEAAFQELKAANANHARVTHELEDAEKRINALSQQLDLDRAGWDAARLAWQAEEDDLQRREKDASDAEEQLTGLRLEEQQLRDEKSARERDIADLEGQLTMLAKKVKDQADAVASARGSFATVQDRSASMAAFARALQDMAAARQALTAAVDEVAAAKGILDDMPPRDGFADVVAAQAAWEARVKERADVDSDLRQAKARLTTLHDGRKTIEALCADRARVGEQSRDLVLLADLFAAGRGSDIGLHIYVLKSLFETVMESANRRLESLLNGRYRLVASAVDTGDQRSLQGLGVSVEDRITGKTRPAKSLSGGETFCASLALALGLSDVVRMNAGGVEINSLFIDEGFGSLDTDQLDEVMLMLGHLSSNGRRVGIITHVESMKSTITERIDVVPASLSSPARVDVTWMA